MENTQPDTYTLSEANQRILNGGYSSIFVLVDSNTHQHCLPIVQRACPALRDVEILEIEPGEAQKDIEIAAGLWQAMLDLGADRQTLLVCLGGGVVTDLGGFIGSTFKRGIDFLLIPTSLLAMVDAAIGGKTGINMQHSKNQVGTFAVGIGIVHHPDFLDTLPERELKAGYAEMLKHALLDSEESVTTFLNQPAITLDLLQEKSFSSQQLKKRIVLEDPLEKGLRKVLNFGHTAGHAIEGLSQTEGIDLNHGECVALGMRIALELSVLVTGMDRSLADDVIAHIQNEFPTMPAFDVDSLWKAMLADKKNEDGKVLFVLLASSGQPKWGMEVTKEQFAAVYTSILTR